MLCKPMLLLLALALNGFTCAQQAKTGDLSDALVKWDTDCSVRGCLIQTDVLRGLSDEPVPPDAKDAREYVSLNVAVERATRKPAYFTFMVDPRSAQNQGVFVAFTHTKKVSGTWKVDIDGDGAVRLPIGECTQNACTARVLSGLVPEHNGKKEVNLLDKFMTSDSVLLLYVRDGKAYRTMVLLSSFKKEYERVLTTELK